MRDPACMLSVDVLGDYTFIWEHVISHSIKSIYHIDMSIWRNVQNMKVSTYRIQTIIIRYLLFG